MLVPCASPLPRQFSALWAGLFAISCACASALSCRSIAEPGFPSDAIPMRPPRPYAFWWQLTESCSARTAAFDNVRWYVVPNAAAIDVQGQRYGGYWFSKNNSIAMAGKKVLDAQLVRHEMLHALVGALHARDDFLIACGGIVACDQACLTDVGGPSVPDSAAPAIPLSTLNINVHVVPSSPSVSGDSGWVAITVSARNPLETGAWATLSPVPGNTAYAVTFGYDIVSCRPACAPGSRGEYEFLKGSRFGFMRQSTRRLTFDVRLDTGTYAIRGIFNADTTAAVMLSVAP